MSALQAPRIERVRRRRGSFGLDERRQPNLARVEGEIRAFLALRLPEVFAVSTPDAPGEDGRTLVLLQSRGHAAVLRIEADAALPGEAARALAARCRDRAIPIAIVSTVAEARAALRRFGIEPRPCPVTLPIPRMFARCRAKPSS